MLLGIVATSAGQVRAAPSPLERQCARGLASASSRLAALWTRADLKCRLDVAAGESGGPCPGAAAVTTEPVLRRMERRANAYCGSTCSITSSMHCIADDLCPPLPQIGSAESCSAGIQDRPFDMHNIGFPGPYCEETLGRALESSIDIAECVEELTTTGSSALASAIIGDPAPGSLSGSALACQKVIARRTRRLAAVMHRTLTRCRNAILRGASRDDPDECATHDPAFVARSGMLEAKLARAVEASCADADILNLDLCGAGLGAVPTREIAISCLQDAAREVVDSPVAPVYRLHSLVSLIEAAYPPAPFCGDGRRNQVANAFIRLGEECDGSDDSACPGLCAPPDDLFECSCTDHPRQRFFAESSATDLDHGWTGAAINTTLPDGSGFVMELSACDCSAMDGATCDGTSSDPVCTVTGLHKPRCSWEFPVGPRCDARGNGNSVDDNQDCWLCDAFSLNSGTHCEDESDCMPLCYDALGTPGAGCPNGQSDCSSGKSCRGRCDRTPTCIALPLAPPTPVSNGGSPICVIQTPREDLIGTTNVVTGEHAIVQRTRVRIYQGSLQSVPCPVCGGVCEGGPSAGEICHGSCSVSGSDCRFDEDCPASEFCTSVSARCPDGICDLSLVCHGGLNDGERCRIESETPYFGTVSSDCPPSLGSNVTGNGLIVDYAPATSEVSTIATSLPCTGPGFELYDCPCPDDGGRKTQPNPCNPACDAGVELGVGCADGAGSVGRFTVCSAGINGGRACDEDSDCPAGSCDVNPKHCLGDPTFERVVCADNSDCGVGACVDACPSGRCVPLCLPSGPDPEEGFCASGPARYHCDGPVDAFRTCNAAEAAGSCAAVCELSLTACDATGDCQPGEACIGPCEHAGSCEAGIDEILGTFDDRIGAGNCVEDLSTCPLSTITAEGGDTINGRGDPANPLSVASFCLGRMSVPSANTVVGVGGPGRIRRGGTYATNGFATLP